MLITGKLSRNVSSFAPATCIIQNSFLTTYMGCGGEGCTFSGHLVGDAALTIAGRASQQRHNARFRDFFLSFTLSLILSLSNGSSYIWNRVPNGLSRKPFPKFKTSQAVPDTLNQNPYTLMENMFFSL